LTPSRETLLTITAPVAAAPAQPDVSTLPALVDRRTAAALVTQHYFPVSPRTLEAWPVECIRLNGKALAAPAQYFAVAQAKFEDEVESLTRRLMTAVRARAEQNV
jgi:hypothetical protein